MDNTLVLKVLKVLFSKHYFLIPISFVIPGNPREKIFFMHLQRYFFYDLAEPEILTTKKAAEEVKGLLFS